MGALTDTLNREMQQEAVSGGSDSDGDGGFFDTITDGIGAAWDATFGLVFALPGDAVAAASTGVAEVWNTGVEAVEGAFDAVVAIPGGVIDAADDLRDDVKDILADLFDFAKYGVIAWAVVAISGTTALYFLAQSGILKQVGVGIGAAINWLIQLFGLVL